MNSATSDRFAIKASELTRQFGSLTAVDHIELRVSYGEVFGLLGANGAGKSTVIKMLSLTLRCFRVCTSGLPVAVWCRWRR